MENVYIKSRLILCPYEYQFLRQGGHNYTQNSLIDGFFIKTNTNNQYISTTNQTTHLNSDHLSIHLHIPPNTLIAKDPITIPVPQPRILNPIPKKKLDAFHTLFFEQHSHQMDELTQLLEHNRLTHTQWQLACNSFTILTDKISHAVLNTCSALPIPVLPNHIAKQGGYLPKKSQKQWKLHLFTYHLIRKTIYIIKNNPTWRTHPLITQGLITHPHATIPPPPASHLPYNDWIGTLATIAKDAKNQACKITTDYTKTQIKKAISKYQQLYDKNPKRINRKVFKSADIPLLDCLTDRSNKILTNPHEIAQEIHAQQSINNRPTVPTCRYQPDHTQHCVCAVRQYPWHDLNGYTIEKRGDPITPLHTYLDQTTYDICLKNLTNGKIPGPDNIPNAILKIMPPRFHKLLLLFFTHCYKQRQIPDS